ncbi:MAG: outer membrane beta-barrel protein [Planctomycetia bacterium]
MSFVLVAVSWSLADEAGLQVIEPENVPILQPAEQPTETVAQPGIPYSSVKVYSTDPNSAGIRVIIPTNYAEEEQPQPAVVAAVPQANVAPPQVSVPPQASIPPQVHQAAPIGVQGIPVVQGAEVSPTGVVPDQSMKTIRLLNALSDQWNKPAQQVPPAPSPFKEEPVQTTPKPITTPPKPLTTTPTQEVPPKQPEKPVQSGQRRTPAPIESRPAPIVTPDDEIKPLEPNDALNDDLPYYQYDQPSQPKFRPGARLRERLMHGGPLRQKIASYLDRQASPMPYPGDRWGPGHWVGPGVWMPSRATQAAGPMCDDACCGEPMCGDPIGCGGIYGWGAPCRLIAPAFLTERRITIGGWIDQGITYNAGDPADRYNGPVTFNDRSGDYQMNQTDLFIERKVDGNESGLEIGGRVDVLFGTDARFTAANGWETNWDMHERFYRVSVPQMYADFGVRDWTVRLGHFYSGMGYESVPSVNNFFYSHSYSMQYSEPFTYTGMMATRRINRQLKLNAGFHRGWDQFNGIYDCNRLSVLAGANWVSRSGRLKLDFAMTAGPQGHDNSTIMYSVVGTYLPRGWLECVVQHDYGQSTGGDLYGVRFAEWYSLSQYFFVTLNERWKVGARIECFRDQQGVRVHGLGDGNLATGPYPGDFWEVTLGLNWDPHSNVRIRPEVRWDWYSVNGRTVNRPFDGGNSSKQFLLGVDAVVQF